MTEITYLKLISEWLFFIAGILLAMLFVKGYNK